MSDPNRPSNPWARRSRRTVYDNPWIALHDDEVTRPDGAPGQYGVVHFHNAAVGVVPIDEAGNVLLVGQWRYTLERFSWEIPEGGVPAGESLLEGARRELAEETGYHAREWREILRFATSNSVTDEEGALFVATGLEAGEARPDGSEQDLVSRWVSLDEAVAMIDRGEITDAMSQVALLRVALERRTAPGSK